MTAPLFGFHPVREALRRRAADVVEVRIARGRSGARRQEIEALCREAGIPVRIVSDEELHAESRGVDNGFLLRLRGTADRRRGGDPDLQVLLEDVQDPRNLGAILRVCEGAGVGEVLIRDRGSAPLSAVAVKASAGASEWLPLSRVPNAASAIAEHKRAGFWVYGLAAGGVAPWEVDLTGKVLLCLGGEGSGLRSLTQRSCDALVGLPMLGRVESLNVATAAAAALYEAVRQRRAGRRGKRPAPEEAPARVLREDERSE